MSQVSASKLAAAMALVLPFASRKDDKHPDAACVLIESGKDSISLLCANSSTFARVTIPCEKAPTMRAYVDAQRIAGIAEDCPGHLLMSVEGEQLIVQHADSSAKSKFKLYVSDGKTFPKLPNKMDTLLTAKTAELVHAMKMTEVALPNKENVRVPHAMLIEGKGNKVNLAATDNFRILFFEGMEGECGKFSVLIRPDVVSAFRKFATALAPEKTSIRRKGDHVCFVGGSFAVGGTVVDAEFPSLKKFVDVHVRPPRSCLPKSSSGCSSRPCAGRMTTVPIDR